MRGVDMDELVDMGHGTNMWIWITLAYRITMPISLDSDGMHGYTLQPLMGNHQTHIRFI